MKKLILGFVIATACVNSAEAYSEHQQWTIDFVARIAFAGTGDHCPRFRVINSALGEELRSVGITSDDSHTKEFEGRLNGAKVAEQFSPRMLDARH